MKTISLKINLTSILDTMSNEELLELKTDIELRLKQYEKIVEKPLNEILLCDVGISQRTFNALRALDIITLADLSKYTIYDLAKCKNIGSKILNEIKTLKATYNC